MDFHVSAPFFGEDKGIRRNTLIVLEGLCAGDPHSHKQGAMPHGPYCKYHRSFSKQPLPFYVYSKLGNTPCVRNGSRVGSVCLGFGLQGIPLLWVLCFQRLSFPAMQRVHILGPRCIGTPKFRAYTQYSASDRGT